jgi:hypothetical protein
MSNSIDLEDIKIANEFLRGNLALRREWIVQSAINSGYWIAHL